MARLALEMAGLALAGALVGVAVNAASPRRAALGHPVHAAADSGNGLCSEVTAARPPLPAVDLPTAKALCERCEAGFVDARGAAAFAAGHIAGAVHLPPAGHGEEAAALLALRARPTVIVYDEGTGCALAQGVARRLGAAGLHARVLAGGWPAWLAQGGPGAAGPCSACGAGDEGHHP